MLLFFYIQLFLCTQFIILSEKPPPQVRNDRWGWFNDDTLKPEKTAKKELLNRLN